MVEPWKLKPRANEQQHLGRRIEGHHQAKMTWVRSMVLGQAVLEEALKCLLDQALQIDSCCSSVEGISLSGNPLHSEEVVSESREVVGQQKESSRVGLDSRLTGFACLTWARRWKTSLPGYLLLYSLVQHSTYLGEATQRLGIRFGWTFASP